ncbi:MAG: hypothetical protein M3179_02965 [Actinomycetota bacterium]|nr:hypothetical protein [Actinomycetota bacterium]
MTGDNHARDVDEELLQALRNAAHHADPEPPEIATAAEAALTWRTIDAELAALAYDSVLDDRLVAGIRGGEAPRLLTFEGDDFTIELEITDERRLVGQTVPASPGEVEVRWPAGSSTVEVDEMGRFSAGPVPAGPVSLRWQGPGAGGHAVATDWVTV